MRNKTTFVTVLLTLLLAFPVLGQTQQPIAEIENAGTKLIFHPVVEYERLVLTVTGPCEYTYRQVVTRGEPVWSLDETTIDGRYRYDLQVHNPIDEGIIDILVDARKTGNTEVSKALCRDGKLPAPPTSQTNGVLVSKGKIVFDTETVEKVYQDDNDATAAGFRAASAVFPEYGSNGASSRIPNKDFVINDDLIVDGSACIGFDCVNGESFSFDTIRLKENNLRIKFQDTSVAASFPTTDWQLTANASANGGASKFSIDDISGSRTPFTVEANARSHSLYVDDGGRIGNRTSTPSTEIHTIDGDTPTLRLQQDGSSGFAPQTWDVAGNETNFFIRDVTNGSTLPFRIRPEAPTSSIFIESNGDVGLGTASPDDNLHILNGPDENFGFRLGRTTSPVAWVVQLNNSGDATAPDGLAFTLVGSMQREMQLTSAGDLQITGDFIAGGTTLNVPDYVFEEDYSLMPLEEVAAFIEENSHLPNIPSAGEINGSGKLNMVEMQMKLLEKVEELTLYTLEQQELIERLNARIEALESGDE